MSTDAAIDDHLESALENSEDDTVRYHLRQALQLRIVESERSNGAEIDSGVQPLESD